MSDPRDQQPDALDTAHAVPIETLLEHLGTTRTGLSHEAAGRRYARHGPNELPQAQGRGPLRRLAAQFDDALIYVLLAAALVTALLRQWVDMGAIVGVVVINAVIGFVQEGRAEHALAAVRGMLSQRATVWRDGERQTVAASELVPGDIVALAAGDKVPADLRLIDSHTLRIDESPLTGESEPVEKGTDPVDPQSPLAERLSIAWSGTLVRYGTGAGMVVATGANTALGAMSTMLARVEQVETPLAHQLRRFGRRLTSAIVIVALGVFALATAIQQFPWVEAFLAAVGLAVAAIPQGLPAIMTITLAVGVQAMARRRAVVRRMHAAETLGSVDTICSDKTGTLTRNEMTAVSVALAEETVTVTGSGYAPEGRFERGGEPIAPRAVPNLTALARAALLCNDARVERDASGQWHLDGDPTEGALLTLAAKAGLLETTEHKEWPRVDAIPFSSETRFMATLHRDPEGGAWVDVKGAPERVIAMCDRVATQSGSDGIDHRAWRDQAESLANAGQRVLAIAQRRLAHDTDALDAQEAASGLELLGLVGMMDPPRDEAIEAVAQCQGAGIRIKMITGDHALTARAIGARMGIGDGRSVLTGGDIDGLDEPTLREQAAQVDVFARVSPEHKLRLVEALQHRDRVVAMTGDGVNDAAALKRADVGIAMGNKGTEVAREAAEIVLTDDNFASIAAAVRLGRTAYDNIKRSVVFLLPTNAGEALAIIAAVVAGLQLPITPVQILWVNMVTAATLGLSLAFEPGNAAVMARAPRPPSEPMITRDLLGRIMTVGGLMLGGTFGAFAALRAHGADLALARTAAVNVLVMFEVFYLFNARLLAQPLRSLGDLMGNKAAWASVAMVVLLQLAFTYAPPLHWLFDSAPMPASYWLWVVALAALVVPAVEIEKRVRGRLRAEGARAVPAS